MYCNVIEIVWSSIEFFHPLLLADSSTLYTTIPTLSFQLNWFDSFSILYSLATIYFILFGIYLATKAKSLIKKAFARRFELWAHNSHSLNDFHYRNGSTTRVVVCISGRIERWEKCLKWLRFKLDFPPSISRPSHCRTCWGCSLAWNLSSPVSCATEKSTLQNFNSDNWCLHNFTRSLSCSITRTHLENGFAHLKKILPLCHTLKTSWNDVAFKVFSLSQKIFSSFSLLITKEASMSTEQRGRGREKSKTTSTRVWLWWNEVNIIFPSQNQCPW